MYTAEEKRKDIISELILMAHADNHLKKNEEIICSHHVTVGKMQCN
jgi:uncharacterized tellurite resistance protein B-like protein